MDAMISLTACASLFPPYASKRISVWQSPLRGRTCLVFSSGFVRMNFVVLPMAGYPKRHVVSILHSLVYPKYLPNRLKSAMSLPAKR